jgi:hypothetical protein
MRKQKRARLVNARFKKPARSERSAECMALFAARGLKRFQAAPFNLMVEARIAARRGDAKRIENANSTITMQRFEQTATQDFEQ